MLLSSLRSRWRIHSIDPSEAPLAGLGSRFAAAAVDLSFLVLVPCCGMGIVQVLHGTGHWLARATLSLFPLIFLGQLLALAFTGRTLGTWLCGLQVVDGGGRVAPWTHGLLGREGLRWTFGLMPGMGVVLVLLDAAFVFGPQRQSLRDLVLGTFVVDTRRQPTEGGPRLPRPEVPLASRSRLAFALLLGFGIYAASLAAMYLPYQNYWRFRQERERVHEDIQLLREAELSYHERTGAYLGVSSAEEAARTKVGAAPLTWMGDADFDALGFRPADPVLAVYWVELTQQGFVAYAKRDLDGDGETVTISATESDFASEGAAERQ